MPIQFDQSELLQEAKSIVWRREQASLQERGFIDSNFVRGTLSGEFKFGNNADRAPAPKEADELKRTRILELAGAFVDVSDGKAGVDSRASSTAMEQFRNVVDGRNANGQGFLLSQTMAIKLDKPEMMTDVVREHYQGRARAAETVAVRLVADARPA